ncbi:MAG: hypothetical protein FJZ01_02845 [Candidatus Sericytochromatia bacterium]|nr:hypothetical protein [Candidatus Tanganyikabacteria bacterium]
MTATAPFRKFATGLVLVLAAGCAPVDLPGVALPGPAEPRSQSPPDRPASPESSGRADRRSAGATGRDAHSLPAEAQRAAGDLLLWPAGPGSSAPAGAAAPARPDGSGGLLVVIDWPRREEATASLAE